MFRHQALYALYIQAYHRVRATALYRVFFINCYTKSVAFVFILLCGQPLRHASATGDYIYATEQYSNARCNRPTSLIHGKEQLIRLFMRPDVEKPNFSTSAIHPFRLLH